jgi:hypothetical protein
VSDSFSALVCVTTCGRLESLSRYLPHVAAFCSVDRRFQLLVALDGTDPDYLAFCTRWDLPLVYSDEREGVGLSKNRVLERFPGFDYYFFLDDDVELVDGSVFPTHVKLAQRSGIPHFSLFERGGLRQPTGESRLADRTIRHGRYGGGQFNFYTRAGLEAVGGWHPTFAQYRRWGHTEHSYRFFHAGLAPAPFNVVEELSGSCIWHYPPSVTGSATVPIDADQIAAPERALMDQRLRHVPVQTLCAHHVNGVPFGPPTRLGATVGGDRYPLVNAKVRLQCWSDYNVWRYQQANGSIKRGAALAAAAWQWPGNPTIRHVLKRSWGLA